MSLAVVPRRERRRPRDARGFTLVELTVALVAGLIVAMAIVGLSREATRTFHEEVRSSAAEATLRTAVDRLRADLQRASYMSTPNIQTDPRLAFKPGSSAVPGTAPRGIRRLAGVYLQEGGSAPNAALSAIQSPVLLPDAIEIAGNMTVADQYEVESIQSGSACTRIMLSSLSPAMYRINAVGTTAAATELNNAFQPAPGKQFMLRLVDEMGHVQYLVTCPGNTTAGFLTASQPYVDVDATLTPVLTAQDTLTNGGASPTSSGRGYVNPVQIVRWEITDTTHEPAQYQNALGGQSLSSLMDTTKYDLIRSFVDATDAVVPATTEVIAEYAVDLDFAFSIENGTTAQPQALTYAFDDDTDNGAVAADVTAGGSPPPRPQRIRSIRARVATRAAQADRQVTIPVPTFGGNQSQLFMYRYCLQTPCTTTTGTRWARMRTLTTEVSLPNQQWAFQ